MKSGRRKGAIEVIVCIALVAIVAVNALRRMDYLGGHADYIRMTDSSRTALVARNLAEGNGYATDDLPAALIDFYDHRGKLHETPWVNADRFPFAAYATAALFTVTGSTSWAIGITGYNLIFFVAFLVLLYVVARRLWDDRYAGIVAVALALLHPYTFQFLYWKDGDMMFLTTAAMAMLYRYFAKEPVGRIFYASFGTVLAFIFLARPNLGVPFILVVGASTLVRIWRGRSEGLGASLGRHLTREGLVSIVFVAWLIPFVIHTLHEWGSPLFSANSMYQLPLGTRFGMGTDTWWKYSEPNVPVTLSRLLADDTSSLLSKFTGSWAATIMNFFASYPLEIALTCGLGWWLARARVRDEEQAVKQRPMRLVAWTIAFAFLMNLAILPLYSFQNYSFRHYLAFVLPLAWIAGARALVLLFTYVRPTIIRVHDHVVAQARWYVLAVVLGVVAWNLGGTNMDANRLMARTSTFVETHWLATILLLAVFILRNALAKVPWIVRGAALAFTLVVSCYRPNTGFKLANLEWFPHDDHVWDSLAKRKGLVASFALQGEVAWNTGRPNIPVPEWPMHLYSFRLDHALDVQDVYLESVHELVSGPFGTAAPGFEGYERLQAYRTLPGYSVAFHDEADVGYPRFRIKPIHKASTVFSLTDRREIERITTSPTTIDLGDPANVIYTAHGWDRYMTFEGKRVAVASSVTRRRYPAGATEAPFEDTSVTFFIDAQHKPTTLDLEIYVPQSANFTFFWNLDVFQYDLPASRKAHEVGRVTATEPGWQVVHLAIPPSLLRVGLNKLGFRASSFRPVLFCPAGSGDDQCLSSPAAIAALDAKDGTGSLLLVKPEGGGLTTTMASLFATSLVFHY